MCKQSEIKKLIECFSSTGRCLATSSKADPHHRQQWLAKTKPISTYVSPFWLISFNFFFFLFFFSWKILKKESDISAPTEGFISIVLHGILLLLSKTVYFAQRGLRLHLSLSYKNVGRTSCIFLLSFQYMDSDSDYILNLTCT